MIAGRALRKYLPVIVPKNSPLGASDEGGTFSDYLKDSHRKRILAYQTAWNLVMQK
jgi:hypothetical protein